MLVTRLLCMLLFCGQLHDLEGVCLTGLVNCTFHAGADTLSKLPPSNAYQRRVAGEGWQ